jgi:hypothetical protein
MGTNSRGKNPAKVKADNATTAIAKLLRAVASISARVRRLEESLHFHKMLSYTTL